MDEADQFFQKHLPFEIIYDPEIKQEGIDYERGTVNLSCKIEIKPTDGFKIFETIRKGLIETGKMEEWGFSLWPLYKSNMFNPYTDGYANYPDYVMATSAMEIELGLFDENGSNLAMSNVNFNNYISFHSFGDDTIMRRPLPKGYLGNGRSSTEDYHIVDSGRFSVNASGYEASAYNKHTGMNAISQTVVFRAVNANNITDKLTVKIIKVNDIDAENASKNSYIKISSGNIKTKK